MNNFWLRVIRRMWLGCFQRCAAESQQLYQLPDDRRQSPQSASSLIADLTPEAR